MIDSADIIRHIKDLLAIGETVTCEFKRAGDGPKHDTYETICAFLNHIGGEILLGVADDGEPVGLPEKAIDDMMRSIVKTMNDSNQFSPTFALHPEHIVYEDKHLIYLRVPESPDVHTYRNVCYSRSHESDIAVRGTTPIAQIYIRKQRVYTEQRVYPMITKSDLRLDLLPRVRNLTLARGANHPWLSMNDDELLSSARLVGRDPETGKIGFRAAAALLLGKDDLIGDIFPAYKTDALLRRVDTLRYDDRVTPATNLIESWDQLIAFGQKHLDDKFYINEQSLRFSLRDSILREVIGNLMIHREFSSARPARFIIEKDRIFTDNASKALSYGAITIANLNPEPKNPIIAKFFHNICRADELGSGVRNLYRDVRIYSNAVPKFTDGDVFTMEIPLVASRADDDAANGGVNDAVNGGVNGRVNGGVKALLDAITANPGRRVPELANLTGLSQRTIERYLRSNLSLRVEFRGAPKNGGYYCIDGGAQ